MQRIRTVKPELLKHEDLFDLEQETGLPIRIAWVGLFTCCDREGRFKWRPRALKVDILPYDNVDFSRVLDAFATRGFVVRYTVDGEDFGYIPTWDVHQFINNKEPKSEIPQPPINQDVDASSTREERVDDACETRGVKEGKGKELEGKGEELSGPAEPDPSESDIVNRAFAYYCRELKRDPSRYTLTPKRRKKALLRLRERVRIRGSLEDAAREIGKCIQNLAASEYHVSHGYVDWIEQIFRSAEEFEKRLNWTKPSGATNGNNPGNLGKTAERTKRNLAGWDRAAERRGVP